MDREEIFTKIENSCQSSASNDDLTMSATLLYCQNGEGMKNFV